MKYTTTLANEYTTLWNGLQITDKRRTEAVATAKKILANKNRYVKIEEQTGVPWHFVALCHYRESSLNFSKNLANGQALSMRTTIVPKGRGPYNSFEESAIDSLVNVQGYKKGRDWSQPMYIWTIEGYNGYGYHGKGIPSPYLVGGSNKQLSGKYVRDGVFDRGTWDTQLGVLTILKALMELDPTIQFGERQPPIITKEYAPGERTIGKGFQGADVKWLQEKLGIDADGIFGKGTEEAVKKFQTANGLVADGIVGTKTWEFGIKGTKPAEQPKPSKKVHVFTMYGLGGSIWSGGMESVLNKTIRQLPNVVCPPARDWSQWQSIVNEIKVLPKGSKVVIIGHSMGAAAATFVGRDVGADLLVLYDLAGFAPARIGTNVRRTIDIYDTAWDMVPEWRVEGNNVVRWTSQYGHTGQDDSLDLALKVKDEVRKLAS